MKNTIDVLAVLNGNSDLNKIFDQSRLIDLSNHTEYKCESYEVVPTSKKYYCAWREESPCKNCISQRAYMEERQMTKLQYVGNKVKLVLAIPVEFGGKPYILELVKDITDSLLVSDELHPDNTDIHNIINELNELAVMDPFTNLYNKKYLEKQIKEDLIQKRKTKREYIIVLLDIDNFKWVNDTYGHVNGDLAIQDMVKIIHKHIDNLNCWAARYGGDEFLLAFRNLSYDDVKKCCKSISDDLRKTIYEVDGDRYYITSSYGIYKVDPENDTYESIIKNADNEMYKHKKGR